MKTKWQHSTYDDRGDMVLANTGPGFVIKQITPEVISSKPADGTTETAPTTPPTPTLSLSFWARTLPPVLSRGKPRTSNSSVWSTYQEQRLNSSHGIIKQFNEEPRHTKVTEGEQAKTETSRSKEAEETTLTFISVHTQAAA